MEHGVKKCQRETNVMKFKISVLKMEAVGDLRTACILKTEGTHYFRSPSILKTVVASDSRKVTSYTLKMDAASDSSSFLLL